jgi:hypothetical protein
VQVAAGEVDAIREVPALMVTLAPKVSVPKKVRMTLAPAPLKVEWPETYSGNGGVNRSTWPCGPVRGRGW